MASNEEPPSTVEMQCMQVWGGNEPAQHTLHMTGLDGYLHSTPQEGSDRGGDVYYASSCASGRITRVLLADVAGHGCAVDDAARSLRDLMQSYVNYTSQKRFMQELDKRFGMIASEGRFATALSLSYYAPTRKLSLSNAGHPAPFWYKQAENKWTVLGVNPDDPGEYVADLPLGVDDSVGYQQQEVTLEPGDMLLLYTDAFIESLGPEGSQLGIKGLNKLVASLDTDSPREIVSNLLNAMAAGEKSSFADDDATALLLVATGQKREMKKVLMSPVNLVRGLAKGSPPAT